MPQRFKTLSEGLSYEDYQRVKAWIIRRANQLVIEHGWANCQRIQEELIPILPKDTRPTINAIHLILYNNGRIPHSEAETYRPPEGQLSLMGQQAGDFNLEPEAPPVILEPKDDPPEPEAPPIVSPKEPALTVEEAVARDRQVRDLKQRYTDLKKLYTASLDESGYSQRLYDMLREEVRSLPPAPPPMDLPPFDRPHHPQDLVGFISCIHFGEVVSARATYGLGAYNVALAQARFQNYIDTVISLAIQRHSGESFGTFYLVDVGDNVSGIIHDEIARTNEVHMTKQTAGVARMLACGLRDLARYFPRVVFVGLPGNHGRMWKRPVYQEKADNFDNLAYHMVSLMVADIPNVEVDAPESFFTILDIQGHKFLFTHGDTITAWAGFPWYGARRVRVNMQELVRGIGESFEYFCAAHFHTNVDVQEFGGETIFTGSSKGPDGYSVGKLSAGSDPRWQFFGVHPRIGRTFRYNVTMRFADPMTHVRYLHDIEGVAGEWDWPEPAPDPE